MRQVIDRFRHEELGGITLDWVVLVAALVGVVFGAFTVLTDDADAHAQLTADALKSQNIARGDD